MRWIISAAVLSPAWLATLPEDLQEIVVDVSEGLLGRATVWSLNADAVLEAKWAEQGGKLITLSADEQAKLWETLADVGDTVNADDPAARHFLHASVKLLARTKATDKTSRATVDCSIGAFQLNFGCKNGTAFENLRFLFSTLPRGIAAVLFLCMVGN